jgi:hypothetical protein
MLVWGSISRVRVHTEVYECLYRHLRLPQARLLQSPIPLLPPLHPMIQGLEALESAS